MTYDGHYVSSNNTNTANTKIGQHLHNLSFHNKQIKEIQFKYLDAIASIELESM